MGQSAPPQQKKNAKNRGKQEENLKKEGKSGKRRKNPEEKAKIGKGSSFCPSWQKGLATPLVETKDKSCTPYLFLAL